MDFDHWMTQAWADHADDAAGVAARLSADGIGLATTPAQLARLVHLAHHLHGQHAGDWAGGGALLRSLHTHPACVHGSEAETALQHGLASLALSGGAADALAGLETPDRIRVAAMAAANLAERDSARAGALLQQAVDDAAAAKLADADPAIRALAVAANNIAATLEEKPGRSVAERALMIAAAQTARTHWGRAGGWLETERAEYRLAMSWLQAGDAAQARVHAQQCLAIVGASGGDAVERFFGSEALALAERGAGDAAAHAHALGHARAAFADLAEADRSWCQATLDKLDSGVGAARP